MSDNMHRPELIIIAGPNGSGKTSVTQKFLHHEWAEGTSILILMRWQKISLVIGTLEKP